MYTVFALLCFVVVIHWLIFPYPSGLLHWHCGNLTIAPVPAKQPWWIWINTSCEFIMNDCVTTTKQSTTKPCAYFLGYTVGLLQFIQCWRKSLPCWYVCLTVFGYLIPKTVTVAWFSRSEFLHVCTWTTKLRKREYLYNLHVPRQRELNYLRRVECRAT